MDKIKWLRDLGFNNIGTSLEEALIYRKNKEKAYQEGFKEFIDTSLEYIINDQKYYLHPNINLYVDLTSSCNCDCSFCIAKTKYVRNKIDNKEYIERLEKTIQYLKGFDISIQIVGGEPTIEDKIYSVLDLVDKYKLRKPVIGTNAFGLSDKLIERINSSSVEYINISRHHYNENKNQEIMKSYKLLSNKELQSKIQKLNKNIRVQCNMIGSYIDTYGEVMQFIAFCYHYLGVSNVVFAQLTPLPRNDIYKNSIIDYVEGTQVDIDSILNMVTKDSTFLFSKYRGGVACYYEVWEYLSYEKPITVLFKFSDNRYLIKADDYKNYFPDLVFHTDGKLCGSWNKNIKEVKI